MMKFAKILFLLVFTAMSTCAYSAPVQVKNNSAWKAQIFLANQIKGIGLVDSYQEDASDISYVYDNALAAIAFTITGNYGLAQEILATLSTEVKLSLDNVPYESYTFSDASGRGNGVSYCGNTAWLLQAYTIYQKHTNSKEFLATQRLLADFLLKLQDSNDAGLRGSTYDSWKSTEHNIIACAALSNYGRLNNLFSYYSKAQKIKKFITSPAVWDGTRFNRGPFDSTAVTDVQSLGVLLLGVKYSAALSWAENNLGLIKPLNNSSALIKGFDYNSHLDTVWLEGTLQMSLAFLRAHVSSKYSFYLNEATKAQQKDGSVLLATNTGDASDFWTLQPWKAIAPTCWLIFNRLKFNPLILY
ncbi:MAG: hypothetical protein WDL87_05675 [Candidatus Omnitrophota bacterium]|jgi:hypothetical protein